MSSLPIIQYCPKSDELAPNVETTNALRSTCFHHYCATGEWPKQTIHLPPEDLEEIRRWKKPNTLYVGKPLGFQLEYADAIKEMRLGLDNDFGYVDLDPELTQAQLQEVPGLLLAGHMDMGWDVPEHDLVVIVDIKSSIYAVKDRCDSLQLHAYGIAFALACGRTRYLTGIWDASEGNYWTNQRLVDLGSFQFDELRERIKLAAEYRSDSFVKGSHCSGCWKREHCPAHLVDVGDQSRFGAILGGTPTEKDVRDAIVAIKGLGELTNQVKSRIEHWVAHHGPVHSEDGRKEYKACFMPGRKRLDNDALCKALMVTNLDSFMSRGDDFVKHEWRLIKDK